MLYKIHLILKWKSLFTEDTVEPVFKRPEMTDFEIPLVLEEMIPDGSFNNKHLPKQADIDKILTQINRKYLRRMHLPCSLKNMHFCDTYIAIMFNGYPKHRKAMKKLQQVILSQYMVQGGFLYIYLKNNFGEQESILCASHQRLIFS